MTLKRLMEDREFIEEIMCKTANRCDIWQDRFIYMMARSIYDIQDELIRRKRAEKENEM